MSAQTHHFRPGDFLFREGEPSKSMYVIQKGSISIRKKKGGGSVEVARVYSNEVIGELSFFDRLPRSAAAVALTEVEVLEISFESLDAIYSKIPSYFQTIMTCVAERLRKATARIQKLQKNIIEDDVLDETPPDSLDTAALLAAATEDEEGKKED